MKGKLIALLALVILGLAVPVASMAAVQYARSVIYLSSTGHVIGQQILYCNNVAEHAGTLNVSNPYRIEEQFSCGDKYISCDMLNGVESCYPTAWGDYTYDMTYFRAPLGLTQSQWCNDPGMNHPWGSHPSCGMPAPSRDTYAFSSFTGGWGTP
ncbi:hypothetical protein LQ772_10325 [Frateuria edaphi]|uniref:hypothetical protein n=1 Tax=Frateuria edaphi TaxID=2898793 RepID=UPI001E61A067|nr:hypothetical protein [Frateuria edaphi]UGB44390.1 hypothetical protein LQ772_10325 [Frateuria edaphi]